MSAQSSASSLPSASAADDFVIQLASEHGLVAPGQLEAARAIVAGHTDLTTPSPRLLDVLIGQGALNARKVAELLAAEFGMPMAPDLANIRITGDTLERVPRAIATRYHLIPLSHDTHTLRVVIS